jgi:outer membrane protein assembly factor BamD (BamD/ComL family)
MAPMSMRVILVRSVALCFVLLSALPGVCDQKPKKDNIQKPIAGPRAVALQVTWLFVAPDRGAQKVDRVQPGREMVIAEKSGPWIRVYANTDIQEVSEKDAPIIGSPQDTPPPISGWMEAKGVVVETTPNGDQVLMGEAANQEALASDPRGPAHAAQIARLLYRRLAEMFPDSPLAPEAAWRAADILWQIQKADVASRPSAHERDAYMREQLDDEEMKKIIKMYPRSRQAAMAAYALIDNKLCGDWQGQEKCPEKETEYYEKYAGEYPDGPRTAQALYQAAYRQAVLVDMFKADDNDKKADGAKSHAHDLAARMKDKFPQSDYTARALAIIFKLDQGIPVYGIERQTD